MIITEREALMRRKDQEELELEAIMDQNTTVGSTKANDMVNIVTTNLKNKLQKQKKLKNSITQENNKWIVSCKNRLRKGWDYVIIVIAVYSVVVIPVRIGINPTILDPAYNFIDIFTWFLYVADVIVNFRTTYIDNFGEEVTDPKKINWHYIKTYGFWIDLISLVAFPGLDTLANAHHSLKVFNYCGLLKLNRMFRLLELIAQSNIEKGPKAYL